MAGAAKISQKTGVARQDVYRITLRLEKLGLVQKTLSNPVSFKAIPMSIAASILIDRKKKETEELETNMMELISKTENNGANEAIERDSPQFFVISQKEAILREREKSICEAVRSVDVVNSWKRHMSASFVYSEVAKKALNRGVKARLVIEKPKGNIFLPQIVEELHSHPLFEVRFIPELPKTCLTIYDKKEVFITTSATVGLGECPNLWSKNPGLLALVQDYFEILWQRAIKEGDIAPRALDIIQA